MLRDIDDEIAPAVTLTLAAWEALEAYGRAVHIDAPLTAVALELRDKRLIAKGVGRWHCITLRGRELLAEKKLASAEIVAANEGETT